MSNRKQTKADLEAQLSKALGDLITVKEERNKLTEQLVSKQEQLLAARTIIRDAERQIHRIRRAAENEWTSSIFGGAKFAKSIKDDQLLKNAEYSLENLAAVIK